MLVPIKNVSFKEKVGIVSDVYDTLKEILKRKGLSVSIGDEGGFAPNLKTTENVLTVLVEAVTEAGTTLEKM